jgi:hypothetical protein
MLPPGLLDPPRTEIEARFERAMRNGNVRWLWPDISMEEWQASLRQIETVTRQILLKGSSVAELSGPSEILSIAAFTSGMGPLLGYWAKSKMLQGPTDVLATLELHYCHNSTRMRHLAGRSIEAVDSLARHGVRPVVLKGMETAFTCFPDPGTRALADIDLLIAPVDKHAAGEALRALGYMPGKVSPVPPQQCWRLPSTPELPRNLLFNHSEDPWSIDLQTSLSRRYSPGSQMIELDALRAAAFLEPAALSDSADTLSPTALVLHLSCHASCGLENLTMLRLVEIVLAVRKGKKTGRFSWSDFLDLAQRTRTLSSSYPALYLTEVFCPGTVPASIMEVCQTVTPAAVQKVVRGLQPASAQRVIRCSLAERFMWATSVGQLLRQVRFELAPSTAKPAELWWIYKTRIWRFLRRSFTLSSVDAF